MDSRSKFPTVGFQADISAFADVYFGLRLDFFDAHAMWSCCVIRGKEESATGADAASFVSARTGAETASYISALPEKAQPWDHPSAKHSNGSTARKNTMEDGEASKDLSSRAA